MCLPVQYITGSVNFMGLELKVRPGVFIPRPETELLVETALDIVHGPPSYAKASEGKQSTVHGSRILDLCTGCGNIAISLAKFLKDVRIIASDISDDALTVAQENARFHNCHNIEFVKSNLFHNIDVDSFDIIISNPPYVAQKDWTELPPQVLQEPRLALYGGHDGLDFYRIIFKDAVSFLKEDGFLIIEVGYDEADSIGELLNGEMFYLQDVVKDYSDIDRVMIIRKKNG